MSTWSIQFSWPWTRRFQEARLSMERARAKYEETLERSATVEEVARESRNHRAANGWTERLADIFGGE